MKEFFKKTENLLLILMFLPVILIDYRMFSFDSYWMIQLGEEIFNNGIPTTMTSNLVPTGDFIAQQWLSSLIIYLFYKFLGFGGTLLFAAIFYIINVYLFYCVLKTITENVVLSRTLSVLFSLFMVIFYTENRPQMISYAILLTTILVLEKYVKTNNFKYLFILPVLTCLQINVQSSVWVIIFCFYMAYIFNLKLFTGKVIKENKYNKKPLILFMIISFFTMLINPYGYKNILYIFNSLDDNIKYLSFEMQTLSIENYGVFLLLMILILCCIVYFVKSKFTLRFLLLFLGTTLLFCINIRSCIYFFVCSLIFIADYINEEIDIKIILEKIFGYAQITLPLLMIVLLAIRIATVKNYTLNNFAVRGEVTSNTNGIVEAIKEDFEDSTNPRVYSQFDIGGYLQFNGCDAYLNSGLEPFLLKNNHNKDYIDEFINLQFGRIDEKEFLDEYDFDYLVLKDTDILYNYANENYDLIFTNNNLYLYRTN